MRILTGLVGAGLTLAAVCGVSAEYVLTPEATREIQDMLASGEWGIRTSWPLANDADQREANPPLEFVPITVHVVRSDAGSEGVSLSDVDAAIATANRQFNDPNDPDHDVETGYFGYKFYRSEVVFLDSDEYFWFHLDGGEFSRLILEDPIEGTVNAYFVPHFQALDPIAGVSTLPYGGGAKGMVIANDGTSALPHELGHYFGLLHTFEWEANGDECASGDGCEFGGDLICETPADPGTDWWGNFNGEGYCYRCDTAFVHPYDASANNGAGALEDAGCVWSDVDCDDRGADCEIPYDYCEDDGTGVQCHAYEPMTENIMSYYQPEDPSTSRFVPEQLSLMRATLKFRFADHVVSDFDCNGNDLPDSFEIESPWHPETVDCDGNDRPDECDIEQTPDIDCDTDGLIDSCEITAGHETDCNGNGRPDDCDITSDPDKWDCNNNGILDICEIEDEQDSGTNCNYDALPVILDECEIETDPSLDCNEDGVFDLCEIQEEETLDCNGNGKLDSCEFEDDPNLDCNGNGVFDACDIEAGDGTDCNGDGKLDACEIEADSTLDCDEDGVLDLCAIESGEAEDCNDNDIPDQCEDTSLVPEDLLTDQDPDWQAYLGTSVSIYGRFAVSGSPGDDSGVANNAGAISFFERPIQGDWSLTSELKADMASNYDGLGASVSIGRDVVGGASGDVVVVGGAPGDDEMGNDAGSAIAFRRTDGSWSEGEVLYGSNINAGDQFGSTLVLDGTRLAVAAPTGEPNGMAGATGQVYMFGDDGTSWTENAVVSSDSGDIGDAFGSSIALDGDRMLIGSPGFEDEDNGVALNAGAAQFFDYDLGGWQPGLLLTDDNGETRDAFGTAVSFDGQWAAVGAPLSSYDGRPADSGSVVLFREVGGSWQQDTTLTANDAYAGDRFGSQVVLDGNFLLVGSPYDNSANPIQGDTGEVYVFVFKDGQWTQNEIVQPKVPEIGMLTGSAVAMRGGMAIIGAPRTDNGNVLREDQGAAFFVQQLDCDLNGQPDTCELGSGMALDCDGDGIVDSCGIDMRIAEDCNGNAIPDSCDIAADAGLDTNSNGVIDSCEGIADIAGDGVVGLDDLIMLLTAWGSSNPAADLDGNGTVGVRDLILLLEMWNPTA